jgi:beta-phosphoglucomutase-like phosphatase (HAD superfamily)
MERLDAVLFDLDSVLTDTTGLHEPGPLPAH